MVRAAEEHRGFKVDAKQHASKTSTTRGASSRSGQRPRRQGDGVTTVGRSGASDSRKDDDDFQDDDFQDDLPVEEVRPPSRAEELEDAAIMAEVAALEATAAAAVEAVFISEHAKKSAPTGGDSVEVGARGNFGVEEHDENRNKKSGGDVAEKGDHPGGEKVTLMHLRLWDLVTTAHQNRARLVQGLGEGSSGNADGSDNSGLSIKHRRSNAKGNDQRSNKGTIKSSHGASAAATSAASPPWKSTSPALRSMRMAEQSTSTTPPQ